MKKIYRLLFFIVIIILFFNPAKADTTFVSGSMVNQNWRLSGSPYVVTGNITVTGLSIDPGVSVLFAGDYEFLVTGKLEAIGSESAQIIFTTRSGISSWKGIQFQNSLLGSNMKWCIVEKANYSGIRIVESLPSISYCTIRNNSSSSNGGGINISNFTVVGKIVISHSIIENNLNTWQYGGGCFINSGTVDFLECEFLRNRNTNAFGGAISKLSGNMLIQNCKITGNRTLHGAGRGGGIDNQGGITTIKNSIISFDTAAYGAVYMANGQVFIENCNITYNTTAGVYRDGGTMSVINSIIYFNGAPLAGSVTITYSCVQGGNPNSGNISNDPNFDNPNCQKLLLGSPCIDAGKDSIIYRDACFPPSLGGLRNDMGAYGGPGACNWLYTQDACSTWPELSIHIELTALMEGLYNPATNLMVRPQVERMYLRNATSPYAIVEPAAATLGQNGISTSEFIFNSAPSGTYYLVIKNWNNLETWSKVGGELLYNDGETNYYDFTSASSQAYGNNLKLIGSKWCTYTGAVTPDSSIDLADVLQINGAANAFTAGYNINDLNGDNQVNLTDLLIVYNNSAAFIRVKNPFNP